MTLLALTETKQKETASSPLKNQYYLIYGGVEENAHAVVDIGVRGRKEYWKEIVNCESISKILLLD